MSQPVLIGDIIASILADLKAHDMDKVFEDEWTDITDILECPSFNGMHIKIGSGEIHCTRYNKHTYARNSDLIRIYGTTDFSIKIRRRNGGK